MASILLSSIRKSCGGLPVLNDVSLDIADGEFVTLVGPAGSGKTSLLRLVAGLEIPDRGLVEVGGHQLDVKSPSDRKPALITDPGATQRLPLQATLAAPLRQRDLSRVERFPFLGTLICPEKLWTIDRKVREVSGTLRLAKFLDSVPDRLSRDQMLRIAVARALVLDPVALLADEPADDHGQSSGASLRAILSQLHEQFAMTVLYASCDPAAVLRLPGRIAMMHDGRILQSGHPEAVYDDPDWLDVALFFGSPQINLLPGAIDGSGNLRVAGQVLDRLRASAPEPVTVGIRPEALKVMDGSSTGLVGMVKQTEFVDADLILHVELQDLGQNIVAIATPPLRPAIRVGQQVSLSVEPGRVMAFRQDGSRVRLPQLQNMELA